MSWRRFEAEAKRSINIGGPKNGIDNRVSSFGAANRFSVVANFHFGTTTTQNKNTNKKKWRAPNRWRKERRRSSSVAYEIFRFFRSHQYKHSGIAHGFDTSSHVKCRLWAANSPREQGRVLCVWKPHIRNSNKILSSNILSVNCRHTNIRTLLQI